MSTLAIAPPGRDCDGGQTPTFTVVIGYEDLAIGKQAMTTYSWLLQEFGEDYVFDSHIWKFEEWRTPLAREVAAAESARADMIIVAAHANSPLPDALVSWTALWLDNRQDQDGALVLLLDNALENARADSLAGFLEKSAQRAGMDFFSQSTSGPKRIPSLERIQTTRRNAEAKAFREEIASESRGTHRWWGLNE